jgi:cell division protein FtsB
LTYAVIVLVSQQVTIAEKRKENQKARSKVIAAQQTNDELSRLLSMSDEKEFMEKIAIERLGYAYPNERRVFDASRN